MSIKDRLAKKTQDLVYPAKGDGLSTQTTLRTGPGQMLMVNSLMRESNEKLAVLEARLAQFKGGLPVLLLDPAQVVPSKWANRVSHSFESTEFQALRTEIAAASGNVQPIKVRPLANDAERYEIVFGHRRHRACLELNLPVLSVVEDLSDAELFKQMDRENRARANLAPWEQGMMYRQALDAKLFTSRENLARELNIDAGNLSKALRLAELDSAIVAAFASPLDLQYRWAKPLSDAFEHDRVRVGAVLHELASKRGDRPSAKIIFDRLIGIESDKPRIEQIKKGRVVIAELRTEGEHLHVKFGRDVADQAAIERLREFIQNSFLG